MCTDIVPNVPVASVGCSYIAVFMKRSSYADSRNDGSTDLTEAGEETESSLEVQLALLAAVEDPVAVELLKK